MARLYRGHNLLDQFRCMVRYKALDRCFRDPNKTYTKEELIEACNKALKEADPKAKTVGLRTIHYDIEFMRSERGWKIPLIKYNREYKYSDLSFSIDGLQKRLVNEIEIQELRLAVNTLCKFKILPGFEWTGELVSKVNESLVKNRTSNIPQIEEI